jgi:hypothetical protein
MGDSQDAFFRAWLLRQGLQIFQQGLLQDGEGSFQEEVAVLDTDVSLVTGQLERPLVLQRKIEGSHFVSDNCFVWWNGDVLGKVLRRFSESSRNIPPKEYSLKVLGTFLQKNIL